MKKKKFEVRVKAETITTKFTDVEVESTSATKARGAAEERAEFSATDVEWSAAGSGMIIISSEIIE